MLTEPGEVAAYVEQSGVDSVAISLGTESGIPPKKQCLDFDRLRAIAAQTEAYLVLHGGSGTAPEDVRLAVENGIIAFRFASEMRIAFLDAFIESRQALPVDYPDTRLILGPAREAARTLILERMEQLGCVGKAW